MGFDGADGTPAAAGSGCGQPVADEAERGFHSDVATLLICDSRSPLADGKQNGLARGHSQHAPRGAGKNFGGGEIEAGQFCPGISALQFPGDEKSGGVLALAIGESNVGLQITAGGGVVALRSLEGAMENEAGRRTLHADVVAREVRITLGQLPGGLRDAVKRIRIFGPRELAQPLADEMELRFEPAGLKVEMVSAYAPDEFGVTLPVEAALSPAFSLAARFLAGQKPAFEFLPPKPTLSSSSSRNILPAGCGRRGGGGGRGRDFSRGVFIPADSTLALPRAVVAHGGEGRRAVRPSRTTSGSIVRGMTARSATSPFCGSCRWRFRRTAR